MGMKSTAKQIRSSLRLDSHHAIERFGVLFGALSVACVLLFAGATTSSIANQAKELDAQAIYTASFSTSKTQLPGSVTGVYVSPDRTRAMLLMRFESASSMSANAENYQSFLTGSTMQLDGEPLKTNIEGQLVTFGSTGYLAVVLDSDEPFRQQILNLTMRSNSELIYKPTETRTVRADLASDQSFAEFDQWRLYFNPGASEATVLEALDADSFDAGAIYNEVVIEAEEATLRAEMDKQLEQMRADLARIDERVAEASRTSVDGALLQLPEMPVQIAGDRVVGEPGIDGEPSTLRLETEWVSPRGYDFDWRSGSVEEGYLDDLVPSGESYVLWLADKAAAPSEGNDLGTSSTDWALSNGRLLSDFTSDDTSMQPLFEIRNDLVQAYRDYFTHKLEYQTTSYSKLVDLEVRLRTVRAGAASNTSDEALFTY